MYEAAVVVRSGERAFRSDGHDERGIVPLGSRVSLFIVARRPRWEGSETRVLKAVRSEGEAESFSDMALMRY